MHALLHDVRFPHLQTLALDILTPDAPSNDRALAMLLERISTLQHVAWKHLDPDALSTSALPSLRTLHVEEESRRYLGVPARRAARSHAAAALLSVVYA